MHVIELRPEGLLPLRMASISVAADIGINLKMLAMTLDFALQPGCDECIRCWALDSIMCFFKREPPSSQVSCEHHVGNTISLLDAAIMSGRATDACDVVPWGLTLAV